MSKRDWIDVASQPDERNIPIDKVGVKNVRYPIKVLDRSRGTQSTVAAFNMYVSLPHSFKGTHMSRFIEILNEHRGEISTKNFKQVLREIRHRLDAEAAHLEVEFPYFIEKQAPVSKAMGLMEYRCSIVGTLRADRYDVVVTVRVPVTTLCPCSKAISERGAHNQRGTVSISFRFDSLVWIEEIIELAEGSASSAVYSILKREDEKYVTEHAFDNPVFVEDVVRNVAQRLREMAHITWYAVEVENDESIHNHSAYAYVEHDKREADGR
ncbi:MAG: GTP cyclohydrolase FolE2 [Candidatus Alcyoniella australis]|nr:GTP cyclohydrolase FolE2 [Candidatus Alcyoniella australis]